MRTNEHGTSTCVLRVAGTMTTQHWEEGRGALEVRSLYPSIRYREHGQRLGSDRRYNTFGNNSSGQHIKASA